MMMDSDGASTRRELEKTASELLEAISGTAEKLRTVAADARLNEDLALKLLERRDLPPEAIEALTANTAVMKHRRVIAAVVAHPKTPRFLSMPMTRRLYTFELLKTAQTPALAADLKLAIEETMIARLGTTSAGERLTLAKQGSTRLAGALLMDADVRVVKAALENPRMTEVQVARAVMREKVSPSLVKMVCDHARWSMRREVQIALLRSEHTPLSKVLQFARAVPKRLLAEILLNTRLPTNTKAYLRAELENREH